MTTATIEFATTEELLTSLKASVIKYQELTADIESIGSDCEQVGLLIRGQYLESGEHELTKRSIRIADIPEKLEHLKSLKADIAALFNAIPKEHRWAYRPLERMYTAPVGVEVS